MTNFEKFVLLLTLAAAAAACSTTESRIRSHQAAFDSYPPEVQRKIRAEDVDVGFTREQVAIALGRPDSMYSGKGTDGVRDVWIYGLGSGGPRVGFGFGMGTGGPLGGRMGMTTAVDASPESGARIRVVFQNGKVVDVSRRGDEPVP